MSASAVHLTPTSLSVILISTSCLILAFKAYCIGMVWDCHRYLLLTNRHGLLAGLPLSTIPRFPLFGFLGRRPLVMVRVRGNSSSGENGGGIGDLTAPGVASPGFILNGVPGEPPKGSELPKYEVRFRCVFQTSKSLILHAVKGILHSFVWYVAIRI